MRPLECLKSLISNDCFHHATYRCRGTVWEGIWFYRKSDNGFRGYEVAGCVDKKDPDLEEAYSLLSGKGLHLDSYGG